MIIEEDEKPSNEQNEFAKVAMEIIAPTIEKFGFELYKTEIKKYSTNITWKKEKQFVKVSSTSYPTDYPYFYNLILGKASDDNFFETDWNSIALWKFKNEFNPKSTEAEYRFPIGNQVIPSIKKANTELEKYADSFLNGNLDLYYKLLAEQNEDREPYKIITKN
ncbi:hypothetical protein [Flavobacterium sp. N1719]|uniref:hypothetical protein n=1 Tax=Flavobacterium sp. N1719 TaxID=2885633 RepID=UPI0022215EDB|nr:hypothetical protein [Flavobacterium sp. N1719]